MRYAGDFAADHDVRLGIETHLGLTHSGALVGRLLDEVDHPSVGVTYDTGNIYFYNDDVDPVEDVKHVLGRVVAVHLKDTAGGKGDWAGFCDLGDGKVDLPAIVQALDGVGFLGPYAIELEAKVGQDANRADCLLSIERSLAHLRRIGLLTAD
jgi:inosose dehydratase